MKASIKLHTSVETKQGHPVIVYLAHKYKEKRVRTGYFSIVKHWNEQLAEPKRSHPEYNQLLLEIKKLKSVISEINYQCNTMKEAVILLKGDERKETFFDIVSKGVDTTSSKYSALKSFDSFYPKIKPNEISTEKVEKYVTEQLKTRKPAGVDSYVRSLRALWNANINQKHPFKVSINIPKEKKTILQDHEFKTLINADLKDRANDYRNFFLLQFYLGGIDFEVLARLKKSDIINDRIEFNRDKGRSKAFCSNKVFPKAKELFYEGEYIIPVQQYNYRDFRNNYTKRLEDLCKSLKITILKSKTARYTFINRAKNLVIDQRVVGQIVGHSFSTTTGLYENDFPLDIQDAAHERIIDVVKKG